MPKCPRMPFEHPPIDIVRNISFVTPDDCHRLHDRRVSVLLRLVEGERGEGGGTDPLYMS